MSYLTVTRNDYFVCLGSALLSLAVFISVKSQTCTVCRK